MRMNDPKNAKQMISDLMDAITYAADRAAIIGGQEEVNEVQRILETVIDLLIEVTTHTMAAHRDIEHKMTELALINGKKLRGDA
jgi:hypothetical protein